MQYMTPSQWFVLVPSTATLKAVKEAVAQKLGRPDINSKGRLVRRTGNGFSSLKDSQKLEARRKFLLMGVDDLQPGAASPGQHGTAPTLTLEKALALQKDILEGVEAEGFQREIEALEKKHQRGTKEFAMGRTALCFKVQIPVLPKYGFEASMKGVLEMVNAMNEFNYDQQFSEMGSRLSSLMRIDGSPPPDQIQRQVSEEEETITTDLMQRQVSEGSRPDSAAEADENETQDVEITISHPVHATVVSLSVASNATIKQIKEALAEKLSRPEVTKARLVKRVASGGFTSLAESEKLGARRKFLVMGIDDLNPSASAAKKNTSSKVPL